MRLDVDLVDDVGFGTRTLLPVADKNGLDCGHLGFADVPDITESVARRLSRGGEGGYQVVVVEKRKGVRRWRLAGLVYFELEVWACQSL